jgi:hypothetical protein
LAVGSWQLAVILKNNDRFSNSFSLLAANCQLMTANFKLHAIHPGSPALFP